MLKAGHSMGALLSFSFFFFSPMWHSGLLVTPSLNILQNKTIESVLYGAETWVLNGPLFVIKSKFQVCSQGASWHGPYSHEPLLVHQNDGSFGFQDTEKMFS